MTTPSGSADLWVSIPVESRCVSQKRPVVDAELLRFDLDDADPSRSVQIDTGVSVFTRNVLRLGVLNHERNAERAGGYSTSR